MQEQLAFTKQLLSLAAKKLSLDERNSLSQIINGLFNDLDLGHSCSILFIGTATLNSEDQIKLLLKSGLTYEYTDFPSSLHPLPISILNINGKRLVYITKYLQYELDILDKIKRFSNPTINSDNQNRHNHESRQLLEDLSTKYGIPNNEQLQAIYNSLRNRFSIITGGPGTGKTTTVAILLWSLYQNYGDELKVKICAPTGKSSKRVKDSIQGSINNPKLKELDFSKVLALLENRNNFLTIHKLLGYQANSIYFRHNKNNLLDLDVLIIDECSMVSLPLFSKLLQAIDADRIKHIVLLGDKNQLSSVEEGYVFASLVNATSIKSNVTSLVTSNRNNKEIGDLAAAVQAENIVEVSRLLYNPNKTLSRLRALMRYSQERTNVESGDPNLLSSPVATEDPIPLLHNNIKTYKAKISTLFDKQLFSKKDNSLSRYFEYISQTDLEDIPQLFKEYSIQTVLCLTNVGLFGTIYLNLQIEKEIRYMLANINNEIESSGKTYDLFSANNNQPFIINGEWYTGRPIIILENDYSLELFNGDIGICIIVDDQPQIIFENGRKFIPEILPKYQVAYAITIHKSQGSEYNHVNLVLCDNSGIEGMKDLLTKELVYTGITRAKTSLSIFAGDKVLPYAISNKTLRNTGLDLMLC
ncbi:MAG: recD [Burkholderiales bacterium]|nr:recD [Burkholderiales bacterium]